MNLDWVALFQLKKIHSLVYRIPTCQKNVKPWWSWQPLDTDDIVFYRKMELTIDLKGNDGSDSKLIIQCVVKSWLQLRWHLYHFAVAVYVCVMFPWVLFHVCEWLKISNVVRIHWSNNLAVTIICKQHYNNNNPLFKMCQRTISTQ